jgi:Acetyltransferases
VENVTIREIGIKEVDQLQKIGKRTFIETFASENTEENMSKYLRNGFSLTKLKRELTKKESQFYFAEIRNEIIGYLKINTGQTQTELKDNDSLEIERIYVLKEFHGKGVGQIIINKVLEIAKLKRVKYVWLGVWEENPRAIRFYEKNGFVSFDKHIFKLGADIQTDIMMKLEMR